MAFDLFSFHIHSMQILLLKSDKYYMLCVYLLCVFIRPPDKVDNSVRKRTVTLKFKGQSVVNKMFTFIALLKMSGKVGGNYLPHSCQF